MNDTENNKDELPRGWARAHIDELIDHYGVFCDGDWVETKDQDPDGDVRLIQLADIGDGMFRNRSNRFLTSTKAAELGCTFLEANDVLIARMPDPLGRACIFPGDTKRCVTAVDVCVVRTGLNGAEPRWLAHTVNSSLIRSEIAALQSGSTRKRISRSNLAKIPLPLPPLPEQRRIVTKIEELFTRLEAGVEALKRTKALLKRYRQSVLKAAVEGRLTQEWRDAHKDDLEPASKLLERISQERRRRFVEKARDSVRAYVSARVSGAAVHNNPREMLEAFLTEMVVNDIDLSHARLLDRIAADFFELMAGIQDLSQQIRSYVLWLRHSLDALQAEGLKSDILISQWEAWQQYVEKEKNRKGPRREIVAIFGVDGGMMDAFSQWLTGESLRDHGAAYLRRTLIEEPAERNWKADETKRQARQPDLSNLPELPEGWEWTSVEQLAAPELNSITDGPFGSNLKTEHYTSSGPRVIRLQNIGQASFIDEPAHISEEHFRFLSRHQVFPGDIVIAGLGSLAPRACQIPPGIGDAIVKADCIRLKVAEVVSGRFVMFALNSDPTQRRMEAIIHGVGRPRLNLTDIKTIAVALPPQHEQIEIAEEVDRRLSIADEVEATIDANLKRAERLRQSILKQAFEGKLVPQDPNDEPASVLLERIREEKAKRERESKAKTKSRRRGKAREGKGASPEPTLPMSESLP